MFSTSDEQGKHEPTSLEVIIATRAAIRSIQASNGDSLEHFVPEDPDVFNEVVRLYAGPLGAEGEESFDINVRSVAWLTNNFDDGKVRLLRHTVIMKTFDYKRLEAFILSYVLTCTGDTWNEIGLKLSRLGHWEFEDYDRGHF